MASNKVVFGDQGQRLWGLWPAKTSCNSVTVINKSTAEPSGILLTNYHTIERAPFPGTSSSQRRTSFRGFGSEDLNSSHNKLEQYFNCPTALAKLIFFKQSFKVNFSFLIALISSYPRFLCCFSITIIFRFIFYMEFCVNGSLGFGAIEKFIIIIIIIIIIIVVVVVVVVVIVGGGGVVVDVVV